MSYSPPRPTPPSEDGWASRWAGIAAMRGFFGESTIRETGAIDYVTRLWLPIAQALALFVAFAVFCFGSWVLVDSVLEVVDVRVNPGSYLVLVLVALLTVAVVWQGVRFFLSSVSLSVAIGFVLAIGFFVAAAVILAMVTLREDFTWLLFLKSVGSAGAVLSSILLIYHLILNILDPYWKTSPAERELLGLWRSQPEPESPQGRPIQRYPWRHGGRSRKIVLDRIDEDIDYPDEGEYEYLDFLKLSRTIGLGRNAWVRDFTRHFVSTGREVTEPAYNDMINRLEDDGYIVRGGSGRATRWATGWTAESVYDKERGEFIAEWGEILGIGEDDEDFA